MERLSREEWEQRAAAHRDRLLPYVEPHLERRRKGVRHPVFDFLFSYYAFRPAQLLRWHPGYGVELEDAPEYLDLKGYSQVVPKERYDFLFTYYAQRPAALRRWHPGFGVALADASEHAERRGYAEVSPAPSAQVSGCSLTERLHEPDVDPPVRQGLPSPVVTVTREHLLAQVPLLTTTRRLLAATASRPATLGCFGLHEWAMVHRAAPQPDPGEPEGATRGGVGRADGVVRHDWPLRLGGAGTDAVVESHRITCSHFDAFRFFTPTSAPLNTLSPGRDDREAFEQPGCLHAGMDLYKHAFRLTPLVPSELVADCFALAWDVRELDMRASPYDFAALGFTPVRIETPAGKQEYVAAQRAFAERGAPLRARLVAECDRLLAVAGES